MEQIQEQDYEQETSKKEADELLVAVRKIQKKGETPAKAFERFLYEAEDVRDNCKRLAHIAQGRESTAVIQYDFTCGFHAGIECEAFAVELLQLQVVMLKRQLSESMEHSMNIYDRAWGESEMLSPLRLCIGKLKDQIRQMHEEVNPLTSKDNYFKPEFKPADIADLLHTRIAICIRALSELESKQ